MGAAGSSRRGRPGGRDLGVPPPRRQDGAHVGGAVAAEVVSALESAHQELPAQGGLQRDDLGELGGKALRAGRRRGDQEALGRLAEGEKGPLGGVRGRGARAGAGRGPP